MIKQITKLLIMSFLVLSNLSHAATITVLAGDGADLKQAIEVSANAGDTVELPDGTYLLSSQINWPNKTNIILRAATGANSSNVIISANSANNNRFAAINNAISLSIQDVTIKSFGGTSFAGHGGVIYFDAAATLNLTNCILSSNIVGSLYDGGCFFGSGSSYKVFASNVFFRGNQARHGAVAYMGIQNWTNCLVINNTAGNIGGVTRECTNLWKNCLIQNNTAASGGVVGPGTNTFINCSFLNNSATNGSVAYYGYNTWTNCSISANSMTEGIIFDDSYSGLSTANNTIFAGKLLDNFSHKNLVFRNCLIQGDSINNYPQYVSVNLNNLNTANALFTDSSLHIGAGSQAYDNGDIMLWLTNSANQTTGLGGASRISGNIDIGAYETGTGFGSYRVRGDFPWLYNSIEAALDSANNGSVIEIVTATYLSAATIAWPSKDGIILRAGPGLDKYSCIISPSAGNTNCFISHNYAIGLTLENLKIKGFGLFSGGYSPGGVLNFSSLTPIVTLNNLILNENKASHGGVANYGTIYMNNCIVSGNMSYSFGGATRLSSLIARNTIFINNITNGNGGVFSQGNITLNNCSISMNNATMDIMYDTSSSIYLKAFNSIILGKLLAGGGSYTDNIYKNCIISDPSLNTYGVTYSDVFNVDPQFTDSLLHIAPNSFAIGYGSSSTWLANSGNLITDLDGNPRISGNIDLGTYEIGANTTHPRVSMNNVGYAYLEQALASANANDVIEIITSNYMYPYTITWPSVNNITLRAGAGLSTTTCVIQGNNQQGFVSHNNPVGLTMENMTIRNFGKSAAGGTTGGVFYSPNTLPKVTLNYMILEANKAINGGISNYGTHFWSNCIISGNNNSYGTGYGGVANYGTINVVNCLIISNNTSYRGGVMNGGELTAKNTIFLNNKAEANSSLFFKGKYTLYNCTISANNMANQLMENDSTAQYIKAYNSILVGNILSGFNLNSHVYKNCLIKDPSWNIYAVSSSNCVSADPLFINDRLEVSENSPAWEAGSSNIWYANSGNITSDLKGYPRVKGTVDIGAYELMKPDMVSASFKELKKNTNQYLNVTINAVPILTGEPEISTYEWYVGTDPSGSIVSTTGPTSTTLKMGRFINYIRVRALNTIGLHGPWKTLYKNFFIPYSTDIMAR